MVMNFGKNKKAAYLTPDYTYGHTVTKSMHDYLATAGWTTATNQVTPLGAPDYSSYLLNIAHSGADVLINVNWGHDAVLSTQQAEQFGVLDKMKLVFPALSPFIARDSGGLMQCRSAATDYWWTIEDKYPLAKLFNDAFDNKYGYKPEWGAANAYISFAHWASMVEEAGSFYPPDIIRAYERAKRSPRSFGDVHYRPEDHQCVRPVIIVKGKAEIDVKSKEDECLRRRRNRARRGPDAETRRVRLQSRRIHLSIFRAHAASAGVNVADANTRSIRRGRRAVSGSHSRAECCVGQKWIETGMERRPKGSSPL